MKKTSNVYRKVKKANTAVSKIDNRRYTKYTKVMDKIIYHGSDFIIEKPRFLLGNIHNDYGQGFYCSSNKALAKEWASRRNGHGYISRYKIRDDRLKILDLTKPPFDNVLYWIALLMNNREISSSLKENYPRELQYLFKNYLLDLSEYDVVIGYRADDSYFQFPEAFLRSEITIESLNKIFHAGSLGKQYVLISKRAFSLLHFLDYEEAYEKSREDYYKRKDNADKVFRDLLKEDHYSNKERLIDLIRKDE